jgi:hypothetical protein
MDQYKILSLIFSSIKQQILFTNYQRMYRKYLLIIKR